MQNIENQPANKTINETINETTNEIKNEFPLFRHPDCDGLVYLDNASTTHKPQVVLDAELNFYQQHNSNVHRSVHKLAESANLQFDNSRLTVASFLGAQTEEILLNSGTTAGINLLAHNLSQLCTKYPKSPHVVATIMEHHANFLPWLSAIKQNHGKLSIISDDHLHDPEYHESLIKDADVIVMPHVSNVTGSVMPLKKWANLAKKHNTLLFVDGAQGAHLIEGDIKELGPDAYSFSGHKLYGPMGTGGLFVRQEIMRKLMPMLLGGGIVEDVTVDNYQLLPAPERLEAGTPNAAGIVGMARAIDWMKEKNQQGGKKHMEKLAKNLHYKLNSLEFLNTFKLNFIELPKIGIASFAMKGVHAHDLGTYLAEKNIAVRVGHHCAKPLMQHFGVSSTTRASLAIYNTDDDIDQLIIALKDAWAFFREGGIHVG